MAYLDLRETDAFAPVPAHAAPRHDAPEKKIDFTHEEWSIIAFAQHDGLASLIDPGPVARVLTSLFGGRSALRLADLRLEALRRLAVLAWHHGYAVPVSEMKAFKAAGYTVDQLELMLASISVQRAGLRRRRRMNS